MNQQALEQTGLGFGCKQCGITVFAGESVTATSTHLCTACQRTRLTRRATVGDGPCQPIWTRLSAALLSAACLLAIPAQAAEPQQEQVGRYQMTGTRNFVFRMDTVTGDTWIIDPGVENTHAAYQPKWVPFIDNRNSNHGSN